MKVCERAGATGAAGAARHTVSGKNARILHRPPLCIIALMGDL